MCGGHDGGAVDFIWLAWRLVCAVLKMFLRGASHSAQAKTQERKVTEERPWAWLPWPIDGDVGVGGMWHMMIDVHVHVAYIAFSAGL